MVDELDLAVRAQNGRLVAKNPYIQRFLATWPLKTVRASNDFGVK